MKTTKTQEGKKQEKIRDGGNLCLLGVRIFPFVSFSHGILSHLLLRNHTTYMYERQEKFPLFNESFLLEGQRYQANWAGGKGLAQLLALWVWEEDSGAAAWGGNSLLLPGPSPALFSPTPAEHLLVRAAIELGPPLPVRDSAGPQRLCLKASFTF